MKAPLHSGIGMIALLADWTPVAAQPGVPVAPSACAAHVPEASSRSGLSAEIVLRVMMAESGGSSRIVSPKGAMGCMQIMPATWGYLTARYNLGTDPFDARRNMIGGAMYLAELAARYGMPGALAAYNAGPGRYERYSAGRQALPAETIAYTARVGVGARVPAVGTTMARWQEASIFLAHSARNSTAVAQSPAAPKDGLGNRATLFPLAVGVRDDTPDPAGP
jgi:soluble lytic murein transglycosylase-like protein